MKIVALGFNLSWVDSYSLVVNYFRYLSREKREIFEYSQNRDATLEVVK